MKKSIMDKKLFKLLELMINKEFNSLEELAIELDVSTRSIRNYFKQLNSELTSEIAQIHKFQNKGYKLHIFEQNALNEIIQQNSDLDNLVISLNSPEERVKYVIYRLVNSSDILTMDDLAYEMCISRGTLVSDLKKCDDILKEYQLVITRMTSKGIYLTGEEFNKRLLILDYLYEVYKCKNKSKQKVEKGKIEKELKDLFDKENFHIIDDTLKTVMKNIKVLLIRVGEGKKLKILDNRFEIVKCSDEYKIALKIKKLIEDEFDIYLDDFETIFLTLPLIGRKAPGSTKALKNINISNQVKELVKDMIDYLYNTSGIDLAEDESLIKNLQYHLAFALNRMIFNIKIKNPLLREIKETYPFPYEIARITCEVIKEKYGMNMNEDEIGYMALHYGSYIERTSINIFKLNKVAIICGTGLGTAQLIKIKIKKVIGDECIINTFSDLGTANILLNDYDIIFTTVDLEENFNIPIVKINVLFNEEELKKQIENIVCLKNNFNVNTDTTNISFIKNMISKEKIVFLNERTYKQSLNKLLTTFKEKDFIDGDFIDSVIEREKKSSTALDNGIALPHAILKDSDKLHIGFGILQKPKIVDGKEIKMIILLVIPEKARDNTDLIIKTYEKVLELGRDKRTIEKLVKSKTYDEFIKKLS